MYWMAKQRVEIPRDVAAGVLFRTDRTCCVCNVQGKPVQIHHIDEDPSNNIDENLAVLCFDCHRETQISGGFDRKLDAEQVALYRHHWLRIVDQRRAAAVYEPPEAQSDDPLAQTRHVAAEIELYKKYEDWSSLARLHDWLGNEQTRDEYVELRLAENPPAWEVVSLRHLQGRVDLLDDGTIELALEESEGDSQSQASTFEQVGRPVEAVRTYIGAIKRGLDAGRIFNAAYNLRYGLTDRLTDELFKVALKQAVEEGSIWWQLRCFEELGWNSEREALLRDHQKEILDGDDASLQRELHKVLGNNEEVERLTLEMERLELRFLQSKKASILRHPSAGHEGE